MTTTLKVFFKPRPPLKDIGTGWMPMGTFAGPFHCDGPLPPDATDPCLITCSSDLVLCWDEFHHDIRPLLIVPSLESSSPRALLSLLNGDSTHKRVVTFGAFVEEHLIKCYIGLAPEDAHLDTARIVNKATNSHILGMTDVLVEVKMWACMVHAVRVYMLNWDRYLVKLERRCSSWDRICIAASTVIDKLAITLVPQSSISGSDGSSDGVFLPSRSIGAVTEPLRSGNQVRQRIHRNSSEL
ncbi:hypothetical protein FB451DRAFT_1252482 [Mycena latifolia]|nr:hypothetical protein FB451DRAFT_1252482 [Mycena latifolia]